MKRPNAICCTLFEHCDFQADCQAVCTAGNNKPISVALIAITTNNSTSVKPQLIDRIRKTLSCGMHSVEPGEEYPACNGFSDMTHEPCASLA